MSVSRNFPRKAPALACALGLVAAGVLPAAAQDAAADFNTLHASIRAYELCHDTTFDQPTYLALTKHIDQKSRLSLSVGDELKAIEAAQAQARALVTSWGCGGEPVQELLTVFETELQPASS